VKKELITRLLNIALRGLSMGSRLILIFALAKYLTPAEVGLFGLMLATVSFSVLIVGADYYTYSQRELLARPKEEWSFVIQHQMKAQFLLYAVLLPLQLVVFVFGLMDWKYALWFFALLLLEHVAQEINRLLVAMHRQLAASGILFIRMGSWVLVVIPLMFFFEEYRTLTSIYTAWMIGSALAILIGLYKIRQTLPIWEKVQVDYSWLKKGFKVGGLFLLATLCFKGLLTFDRYAVEALSSLETLGVYVFYIGIVMGAYNFLDPAVFSFLYPRMLQSYQMKEKDRYQKTFKELTLSTVLISILLAAVIWFVTPLLIQWVDKPIYSTYINSLGLLIAAGFVYAIGYVPHYALYAMKSDRWIVASHVTALIMFFVSLALFKLDNGIETVALALLLAFSCMAMLKLVGCMMNKTDSNFTKVVI